MSRSIFQALFVFLFKLRTGNSNDIIANILELPHRQKVSSIFTGVMQAFERVVVDGFGPKSLTRQDLLEATTPVAKRLLNLEEDQVVLILDGTYIRHQKSTNSAYQRRSYSGQKKVPLCKPFTICTTNGLIVDFAGPFSGNQNDATIVKQVFKDQHLLSLLKPGDIFIVDRGFRDAVDYITNQGYKVLMPALKGARKQLPSEEANYSRRVTKLRWVVEAVHGIISQRYRLLHNCIDNKLLPKVQSLCRIVGFLQNKYGQRFGAHDELSDKILDYMESRWSVPNTLGEEVEQKRWNRRPTSHQPILATDLTDFPKLTKDELLILITGPYQFELAVSYLAETMDADNNISMTFVKETPTIIGLQIRSRHVNRKTYRIYVDYVAESDGIEGIRRYWCECPNGNRTVGCCSHIASAIYYLSYARYLPSISRPAEMLSDLFLPNDADTESSDVDSNE